MDKDFRELLQALNRCSVRYLLIGGYAYGMYTEPRATKDLDVYIATDEQNAERVFAALAQFDAPLSGMSPQDFNNEQRTIYFFGVPPFRVDVLQHIEGIEFEAAWSNRVEFEVDGVRIPVISKPDLITNKLAVGRPRDLLDAADLQAIT